MASRRGKGKHRGTKAGNLKNANMDTAAAPCYSRFQLWTFAASKLYVKPAVINDVVMVAGGGGGGGGGGSDDRGDDDDDDGDGDGDGYADMKDMTDAFFVHRNV